MPDCRRWKDRRRRKHHHHRLLPFPRRAFAQCDIFAADRMLVPVSSDFLSLRGALQIEHTLKALEPVLKRRIERRYLLTRFDRRRKMSFEIQERLSAAVRRELCETVISENVAVAEAPALNRDIFAHSRAAGVRGLP
jgi:chromosome partitioning protein